MENNFTDSLISEFLPEITFVVSLTTTISKLANSVENWRAGFSNYAGQDTKLYYKNKEDTFVKLVSLGVVKLASTQAQIISATNSKNYFCDVPYTLIQSKQNVPVFIPAKNVKKEEFNKSYDLSTLSLVELHDIFLKQEQFYSTYMPGNSKHLKYKLNEEIFKNLNTDDIKNNIFKLSDVPGTIIGGTENGYFVEIEYEQTESMIVAMLIQKFQCKPEKDFSIELNYDNSDTENSISSLSDLPDIKSYLKDNVASDNVQWIDRTIKTRGGVHGPARVGSMFVAFVQGRSIIAAANDGQLIELGIYPGTTWVNKQDSCTFHIGTGDNKADLCSADGKITYENKYNKTIEKAIEECNNAKNTPTYILISPYVGGEVSSYECSYDNNKIIGAKLIGTKKINFEPLDLNSLATTW